MPEKDTRRLSLLEFHPGPLLRSAEAGERLATRK